MTNGRFIVLEGIEGSGKSTQARLLVSRIRELGLPVVQTREPGGTPIGEAIRQTLLSHEFGEMMPATEALLNFASRAQHVSEVIRPALASGTHVVCDRFGDSTLAYQGGGRGLPLYDLDHIHRFATGGLHPDLRILLDVDPALGIARKRDQSGDLNRLDSESPEFHIRIREAFHVLAEADPAGWMVLNGTWDQDSLSDQIAQGVAERFPELEPIVQ